MGATNKNGCKGCLFFPFMFFAIGVVFKTPVVIPLAFLAFFIWFFIISQASKSQTAQTLVEVVPPPVIDTSLREIRKLRDSILSLLTEHRDHPMLGTMDLEIRAETEAVEREAEQIAEAKLKALQFLGQSDATDDQIRRLEYNVATETNPRIRTAMEATLERTRAEMDNVRRLSEQVRYFDALLNQAEATLAELQTRIGVSLSDTEEYTDPRSRLALTEASGELKNVSDAMRQTLNEIA